jgi:hypothetical protein
VLADAEGIRAVLWAVAIMPLPALLLAITLPRVAPAEARAPAL